MIYNAKNTLDINRARSRLEHFISNEKTFELTEKRPKKSIKQNAYLHLILSWFALEYGETLEYVKQEMFKKIVNKDIFETEFVNKKTGEIRKDWRSVSELDSKEMTISIDRFRNYASKEAGVYLPEPTDLIYLQEIENQIKNNIYL